MQAKRCAVAITYQMPFGAALGAVGRIKSSGAATQWRRQHLGVSSLPLPINSARAIVALEHVLENGADDPFVFPFLKAAVHGAARPICRGSCFPLAASP